MADFVEKLQLKVLDTLNNKAQWWWAKWDLAEIEENGTDTPIPTDVDWVEECTIGEAVNKIIDFTSSWEEAEKAINNLLKGNFVELNSEY